MVLLQLKVRNEYGDTEWAVNQVAIYPVHA